MIFKKIKQAILLSFLIQCLGINTKNEAVSVRSNIHKEFEIELGEEIYEKYFNNPDLEIREKLKTILGDLDVIFNSAIESKEHFELFNGVSSFTTVKDGKIDRYTTENTLITGANVKINLNSMLATWHHEIALYNRGGVSQEEFLRSRESIKKAYVSSIKALSLRFEEPNVLDASDGDRALLKKVENILNKE